MTTYLGGFFKQMIMTFAQLPPIKENVLEAQRWQEDGTLKASKKALMICRGVAWTTAFIGWLEFTISFTCVQNTAMRLVMAFIGIALILMGAYISAITIMAETPRTIIVQNKRTTTVFKISLSLYAAALLFATVEANPYYATSLICSGLISLYLYQKKANKNV
ncbi:TPA: hypothetical protein ACRL4E_001928 [Pseudomonas aeruginosa]|uniref:hypothetical protein n=1 Tax=Pseudomonas nitroreducens TaxID=46680 RepID=UPI002F357EDD